MDPRDGRGGRDRGGPGVGGVRHRAGHRRPPERETHRDAPRRGALRGRALRLSRAATGRCCAGSTSTINPGETLALVGATGAGKTTVASLLVRLQDATRGRVTLDGHDVRDLTLRSLRAQVGLRVRGADAVLGERAREPAHRPSRRDRSRHRGRARGRAGGVRVRAAVGPRHAHRRTGAVALGWAAPAARARARDRRPAAGARARRPAVGARRAHRGTRRSRRCARSSPTAPRWSSCTGRRRSRSRTAPRSSTTGASSRPVRTAICSRRSRATPRSSARPPRSSASPTTGSTDREGRVMIEPDEIPDVDLDAPARPHRRRSGRQVARRRGRGRRRAEPRPRGPAAQPEPPAARFAGAPARALAAARRACSSRSTPPRSCRGRSSCRSASTTASRRSCTGGSGSLVPARERGRGDRRHHAARRGTFNAFLKIIGRVGQDVILDLRRARLHALPGPEPLVPRAVHVGTGDLAPDLRRRSARRHAEVRHRHARHVGAHDRRASRWCSSCSTGSSRSRCSPRCRSCGC